MKHKFPLLRSLSAGFLTILSFIGMVTSSRAHFCGPLEIHMVTNQIRVYTIRADVIESEKTTYALINVSTPAVATATPTAPFARFKKGVFQIKAHTVGQCTIQMNWGYAPHSAGGTCAVTVHVYATEAAAAAGRASSATYFYSTYAADPINTFTGDFYMDAEPDLFLGGPMPLFFQRSYNSGFDREGFVSQEMGRNWTHNFDMYLYAFGNEISIVHKRGKVIRFQQNGADWELVSPPSQPYQLKEAGGMYTLMDPTDQRRYFFNTDGNLTSVQDRNGNAHTLTVTNESLAQVSDGLGRTLSFTYSGLNNMASLSDGTRTIQFLNYWLNLESVQDARGLTTVYNYPYFDGRLGSVTRPLGNTPLSRTFTGDRATLETDAYGNQTAIQYNGLEAVITDPLQDVRRHVYSANGVLLSSVDPLTRTTSLGYNSNEQRSSITDRSGGVTSWTVHPASGRVASLTNAEGETTVYTYTAQQQHGFTFYDLTEILYADGTVQTFTRDASGKPLTITTPDNQVWTYTYNARGQVLTTTNPSGGVTTFAYDAAANLASIKSHFNELTEYSYDTFSRVVQVDYPGGTRRAMTYDNNNNLLTVTDEKTNTWTYTYDNNNNLATASDPLGKTLTNTYDNMDRLTRVVDRESRPTDFSYDGRGRVASVTNGTSEVMSYTYDVNDRLVAITNNAGYVTTMGHDAEGNAISVRDALNNEWTYENDLLGRPLKQTGPLGGESWLGYDSLGRLTTMRNELGETVAREYDAAGRVSSVTMDNGAQVAYNRNGLGAIDGMTDPNGGTWMRGYDPAGRLNSETDPLLRAVSYTYDARSRLSTMVSGLGTLTLNYDDGGYLSSRVYSDGKTINYSYDNNGRLISASGLTLGYDGERNITQCNGLIMTYDAANRLKTIQYAPGKTVTYNYNSRGLVFQVIDWVSGTTELGYDIAGNLISITRPNLLGTHLGYDGAGELASRMVVDMAVVGEPTVSSIQLTRNLAGRVTSAMRDLPSSGIPGNEEVLFAADAAHQVVGAGFAYDSSGRRLSDSARSYTWDLASMLQSYTGSGGTTTSLYDAYGLRIQRSRGSTVRGYTVNYAFDLPSVCTITDGTSPLTHYIYLPNGFLLHSIEDTGGARRFYHYDDMGNTIYLSDDSGTITDIYSMTPFGRMIEQTGTTENPFIYGGMTGAMHEGSGLYYMRARYYDADSARFLSRDPVKGIGPRSLNPYQFALNNPKRYADPGGREVRLSGYGRFGLDYSEANLGGGADLRGRTITSRLRLQFDMSAETDSGVSFASRFQAQVDERRRGNTQPDNSSYNRGGFYATSGGFTLGVGNITGAFDSLPNGSLSSMSAAKYFPDLWGGSPAVAPGGGLGSAFDVIYRPGGLSGQLSINGERPPRPSGNLFLYDFGDWISGLGDSPTRSDPGSNTGAIPPGGRVLRPDSPFRFHHSHDLGGGVRPMNAGASRLSRSHFDLGLF